MLGSDESTKTSECDGIDDMSMARLSTMMNSMSLAASSSSSSSLLRRLESAERRLDTVRQLVEEELSCAICRDLFVCANTLQCGHTFCGECLLHWTTCKERAFQSATCPLCSEPVCHQVATRVLDVYLDRTLSTLGSPSSGDLQHLQQRCAARVQCVPGRWQGVFRTVKRYLQVIPRSVARVEPILSTLFMSIVVHSATVSFFCLLIKLWDGTTVELAGSGDHSGSSGSSFSPMVEHEDEFILQPVHLNGAAYATDEPDLSPYIYT